MHTKLFVSPALLITLALSGCSSDDTDASADADGTSSTTDGVDATTTGSTVASSGGAESSTSSGGPAESTGSSSEAETSADASGTTTGDDLNPAYPGWDYLSHFAEMPDGLQMHYLDEGEGDPILMLHGLPTQAFMWRRVIPSVAEEGRVIAPDLINFGLSDKTDPLSPGEQIPYVEALVDELGLENVTLVLHDWGVPIGLAYAAAHQDNVKAVVFFEGPFGPIPSFAGIPEAFAANLIDPATATANIIDDNWMIECFVLDPVCGATSRIYTDEERAVYRAPFEDARARQQILLMPQYLPFLDTTGHPVLDPDGPGGDEPLPAPEIDIVLGNQQWLTTSDTPKLFIYGQPGLVGNGNGAPVAAGLEASATNLSSVQVGSDEVDNFHYIAEDTPQELAEAIVEFHQQL